MQMLLRTHSKHRLQKLLPYAKITKKHSKESIKKKDCKQFSSFIRFDIY